MSNRCHPSHPFMEVFEPQEYRYKRYQYHEGVKHFGYSASPMRIVVRDQSIACLLRTGNELLWLMDN